MEKHVGHIISLTFDIHWTKLLASSNFLLRSSSYGIGQRKQERSYDPKNTHQTAQNIGSQRMYIWREKPRVRASTGNLAMPCQDFRCALVNAHRMDTALWDLGENLIPKSMLNGLCSLSLFLSHRLGMLHEHWTSMDQPVRETKVRCNGHQWTHVPATNALNILTQWHNPDHKTPLLSFF